MCVLLLWEKWRRRRTGKERMRKENKDNAVLTTPDRKMVVLLSCETGDGGEGEEGGRGGESQTSGVSFGPIRAIAPQQTVVSWTASSSLVHYCFGVLGFFKPWLEQPLLNAPWSYLQWDRSPNSGLCHSPSLLHTTVFHLCDRPWCTQRTIGCRTWMGTGRVFLRRSRLLWKSLKKEKRWQSIRRGSGSEGNRWWSWSVKVSPTLPEKHWTWHELHDPGENWAKWTCIILLPNNTNGTPENSVCLSLWIFSDFITG